MELPESTLVAAEPLASARLEIEGITEPTILRYFETLNAGQFQATSVLFAPEGAMHPPFEEAIVGPVAIATYLEAEAKGMQLKPCQGIVQRQEAGYTEIQVTGKVQTPLFGVNVSWFFTLDVECQIVSATIKLLASPQELLKLRR